MARQFRPTWSSRGTVAGAIASSARDGRGQQQATKPPLKASSNSRSKHLPAILGDGSSEVRSLLALPSSALASTDWPRSHTRSGARTPPRPAGPEERGGLSNQSSG